MPDLSHDSQATVDALIARYLTSADRGTAPDPEQFIQTHLEHESALRRYFENLALFEELLRADADRNGMAPADAASDTQSATPVTPDCPDPEVPENFGHYVVEYVLGRGAMGTVYAAWDTSLNRHVALKVPHAHTDIEVRRRFLREARSAARLQHPNICRVYEVGEIDGRHYISMARIRGHTLREFATSEAEQPETHVALLIRKLALAIADAHRHGILHRDLKSANVMVDESGEPIVMDFGLASLVEDDANVTQTGTIVGTPAYMAPEQVEGDHARIGPPTDVYGLGVILYELLTGRLPFRGRVHAVLKQIPNDDPPPPMQFRPGLDRNLEAICLKTLSKRPEDRYPTMDAVAEDLRCFLTHESTLARPYGSIQRARKWVRRHPTAGTLIGVLILSAMLGVGLTAWGMRSQAEADRQSIRMGYAQAMIEGERRGPAVAMLEFAQVLDAAVETGDQELESSIRRQLGAWQLELPSLETVYPHGGHVFEVDVSPDGELVVTSGDDRTARLWRASTGQPVGRALQHRGSVYDVAFSPDGTKIVTASGDDTAQLWETDSGQPIGPPLAHVDRVLAVTFSPDGRMMLTGSEDTTARLCNAETGQPIGQPLMHPAAVRCVAFSPDGSMILTGCDDGGVRIWDTDTQQLTEHVFQHRQSVFAVAFSPDGGTVLTGCDDSSAQLWDVATADRIGPVLQHLARVASVSFSPDGRTILTTSLDWTARFWDRETGQPLGRVLHGDELRGAAWAPDGRSVVTGCWDGAFRRWRTVRPTRLGNDQPLRAVDFDVGGLLLTSCDKTSVQSWDMTTGEAVVGSRIRIADEIPAAAISPDGTIGLACGVETTAQLVDMSSGELLFQPLQHDGFIRVARFSPNGTLVATGSNDGIVKLWDASTGEQLGAKLVHDGTVTSITFSADGQRVLTGSADRTARQWDVATRQPIGPPMHHGNRVYAATYSPDMSLIATASLDRRVRLWDPTTCQPRGPALQVPGIVRSLTFSPDSQVLLTGGDDRTVCLWDVSNGWRLGPELNHPSRIESVVISPDGKTLLSRCQDSSIWLRPFYSAVEGTPEEVILWTQVITGMELEEQGNAHVLDLATWQERERELARLRAMPTR